MFLVVFCVGLFVFLCPVCSLFVFLELISAMLQVIFKHGPSGFTKIVDPVGLWKASGSHMFVEPCLCVLFVKSFRPCDNEDQVSGLIE